MRKLKIFEHISLDGVIQVRGSGEDGDYPYGDWTAPYRSPALLKRSSRVRCWRECVWHRASWPNPCWSMPIRSGSC
jgi:hypothetical protein